MAVLDDDLKVRVRFHLGYPQVTQALLLTAGVPSATEPLFLLEYAMNQLTSEGVVALVRDIVAKLDAINEAIFKATCLVKAKQVGDIQPNIEAPDYLEREHERWGRRLCDTLGVPPNLYSFQFGAGGSGINTVVY